MLAFLFIALGAYAQGDATTSGSSSAGTKSDGGDVTIEIVGSLFQGNSGLSGPAFVRGRYFLSEGMAVRLGARLSVTDEQVTPQEVRNAIEFEVRPGFEYHFAGTSKVSPYVGGVVAFGMRNASAEFFDDFAIDGAFTQGGAGRGFMRLGGGAVIGADYHITPGFFIGLETSLLYFRNTDADVVVGGETLIGSRASNRFDLQSFLKLGFKF